METTDTIAQATEVDSYTLLDDGDDALLIRSAPETAFTTAISIEPVDNCANRRCSACA